MHTSQRHHARLALALAATLTLVACSSEEQPVGAPNPSSVEGASGGSAGASTPVSNESPAPAATAVASEPTTPASPATDGSSDICATVPSLDVINAQLDEPVTGLQELPRTPGEAVCEATGDGIANVQFTMLTPIDRATVEAVAGELGATVAELNDPSLPGAITYSAAVTVFVGDTGYTVQAITFDTISDPTSPVAAQRSATLLAAWLQNLGVSL